MRVLIAATAMLATSLLTAPSAHACMWHEIYPVFWDQKPLFPRQDEVVLRVESVGNARTALPPSTPVFKGPAVSVGFDENGAFRSSCEGFAAVYKVVEVIHGSFDQHEITIVYPIIGNAFDEPAAGERRIVVGQVLPPVDLEARYVSNGVELQREIWKGAPESVWERLVTAPAGGPSTVAALNYRAPPEIWVKMFFVGVVREWPRLPLAWQVGLIAVPIVTVASLLFLARLISRRMRRTRAAS